MDSSDYLKELLALGVTIVWAAPQLDGDGNWLPEIQDGDSTFPTGTWYGFNFPRWRDPETRTLHEVRNASHVDELMAREPRPAFLMLTGHVLDGIDIDTHATPHTDQTDYAGNMRAAVTHPVARIKTPTGGEHLVVTSGGKHNESNLHSQVDYRGVGGLLALPGTRRQIDGAIFEYEVLEFTPENLGIIPDAAIGLYDEARADVRRCNECAATSEAYGTGGSSGIPMGDGTGWDALEEEVTVPSPDDPFGLPVTRDLADMLLTWEGLLSPWFNVVGRKDSDLYLIRAGKAVEGRQGKSAVVHCADNRFVAYSSDLPIATGTQLSKLDVYCAVKEAEAPGEGMPDDFAERMKWMRDRWAGVLYSEHGLDVPRHLRVRCADEKVARTPDYPVLPDSFWEAHPVLKRIRAESEPQCVSPEAVLMCVLMRVLLHIGPQVVLPPKSGTNPEAGATLNAGGLLLGAYGEGKGEAEKVADLYVPSKRLMVKAASGQSFAFMYGHIEKPKKADPHDPVSTDDGKPNFVRTAWSRYVQYAEMDEFEGQMNMQNSTLSPVLRDVLTEDYLAERVAIGRDSRLPAVEGFRVVFVAHGQPTRLDWLLNGQASGGFPQRLWYVYAASERPAEEYLDPDYEAPDIAPLDLHLPVGWEMPDDIKSVRPKICVPMPREARYQARTWQYESEEDDRRGMLNVRMRAYAALLVILPGMEQEEVWQLATEFHGLCYRTRHYALKLIKDAHRKQVARTTGAKVAEQRELHKARVEDEHAELKRQVRRRVLEALEDGGERRRQLHQKLSTSRRAVLDEVLREMTESQEIQLTNGKYELR